MERNIFLTEIKNFGWRKFVYPFYLLTPVLRWLRLTSNVMYFEVRSMRSSLHNQVIVQYFRLWFVLCVICFIKTCTYLRIEPTRLQGSIERSIKQLTFNHLSENFFPFPSRCRSLQSYIRYTVSIKFPSGKHCTSIVLKNTVHYSTI